MRKVKPDLSALEFAMEDVSGQTHYFLDLDTGGIVSIPDQSYQVWLHLGETRARPLHDDLIRPDYGRRAPNTNEPGNSPIQQVDEIQDQLGVRYLRLPKADSRRSYQDIEVFIATVQDTDLRNELTQAIAGQGAFRRFKATLAGHRHERERWFRFKNQRLRQRVAEWLATEDVELIADEVEEAAENQPAMRERLLQELLPIVRSVRKAPGVVRVALIGSIATDVQLPRDADLLVTVTDEANLAPLAKLGRRWRSHVQSLHCSGDIFLADTRDTYLGRTCPWRECGTVEIPQCDARHCGERRYLHDDLGTIKLPRSVVAEPPIELWPELVARGIVPADVEAILLAPLRAEAETSSD